MYVSMYDDVIYLNFLLALGAFVFVKIMAAQPVQRTRSNDDVFYASDVGTVVVWF